MEDSRASLKKSIKQTLKHSIEMVSLRASAIAEGKPYTNFNDDDDDDKGVDNKGKQENDLVLDYEPHTERVVMKKSGTRAADDDQATTLQLCQVLSSETLSLDTAADALLERIESDAGECLLTLRCNVFWPMLSHQSVLASSGVDVNMRVIKVLETIVSEPMSAAVIEAQIESDSPEKVQTLGEGLELIGEAALPLGCMIASMCKRYAEPILGPLIERILAGDDENNEPVRDAKLFAKALVLASSASPTNSQDTFLSPGALYFLGHRHLPEMLFVCRKAKQARKAVLNALGATHNTELARDLEAIWHQGLNPSNMATLNETATQHMTEIAWQTLCGYIRAK